MRSPEKIGGLFAAALLIASPAAFSGDATGLSKSTEKIVVEPKKESNPLSFYNGKLTFDVQNRVRVTYQENTFDFNSDAFAQTDGWFVLERFRLGMMVKPVEWFKFYVQGQAAQQVYGGTPPVPGRLGAEGNDAFDLRQGYFEFSDYKSFPLGMKIGRQILSYGDERLIGGFEWNNFARTFDAVKFRLQQPHYWVEAFTSSVVVITRGSINLSDLFNGNEDHRALIFSGVYFSTDALPVGTLDLYALALDQANGNSTNLEGLLTVAPNQGNFADRTDFVTLGTRIKSDAKKLGGWEYDGEFVFQVGKVRGLDLTAGAVHVGGGYTFLNTPWKPRLYAEYNYATGDNEPGDGELQTFQNLFPTNHKFYGYMDVFSWQNMHNPALSLRLTPCKNFTVQLDGHAFWLATNEDVWYRANGITAVRPLNAAARNASTYCGSEIDLTFMWSPCKQFSVQAGYSHFFAGDYLKDTGAADDANWAYLMATISF